MTQLLSADLTNRGLVLDPRSKLILMLSIVFFTMGGVGSDIKAVILISKLLGLIPIILLLTAKQWKRALAYGGVYAVLTLVSLELLPVLNGGIKIILSICCIGVLRFMPGLIMGAYILSSTTVSEFIAAFHRMRIPNQITIPLSVMFRFFPTVIEEMQAINSAMKMREIRLFGKNAGKLIEYRLIPLLVCSVNIGQELSAAALTRGLCAEKKRTNICRIGFHLQDIMAFHCMYPDIIVMDEPTSNLDLDAIAGLRSIIAEWKADGKTIVIAEHRLDWLKGLCDRAILLKNGGISLDVTGDELFSRSKAEMNAIDLRSSIGLPDYLDSPCGYFGTDGKEISGKVLHLDNFRYSYRSKTALDIKSLDIPAGSVTAVVGHNGAGKSTFVKCLCGLQKRFKGTVTIDGKKYRSRQMLKICYMVMQGVNHQLFAETVLDEVMLGMETENEEQALELLKKLGLYELRDRHPMSLSGGQKQRTAIASAILAGKRILIFDEPTSGLDYNSMVQTAKLIGSLDKNITVLIVTHDMELIERCCTHILHIENGRISEEML